MIQWGNLDGLSLADQRANCDIEIITRALHRNQHNITQTADDLQINRTGLHKLIKRLDIWTPSKQERLGARGRI